MSCLVSNKSCITDEYDLSNSETFYKYIECAKFWNVSNDLLKSISMPKYVAQYLKLCRLFQIVYSALDMK